MQRSGVWTRLGAAAIDLVLLTALAWLVHEVTTLLFPGATARMMSEQMAASGLSQAQLLASPTPMVGFSRWSMAMVPTVVVYGLAEALWGLTVGKRLRRLRVVAADPGQAPAPRLLTRYLVKYSPFLVGLVGLLLNVPPVQRVGVALGVGMGLGFLLALGQSRQSLHDRAAGTAVVRRIGPQLTSVKAVNGDGRSRRAPGPAGPQPAEPAPPRPATGPVRWD